MSETVEQILRALSGGVSEQELLEEYPELEREDFQAVFTYVTGLVEEERVFAVGLASNSCQDTVGTDIRLGIMWQRSDSWIWQQVSHRSQQRPLASMIRLEQIYRGSSIGSSHLKAAILVKKSTRLAQKLQKFAPTYWRGQCFLPFFRVLFNSMKWSRWLKPAGPTGPPVLRRWQGDTWHRSVERAWSSPLTVGRE